MRRSLVQALLIASRLSRAICTAQCNSVGGECVHCDVTSLVQIHKAVHFGRETTQSNPKSDCKFNETLALGLVELLVTALGKHASWSHDTTWMLEDQCKHLQESNDCRKKSSASTCHDGCQWDHHLQQCGLLRVDALIAYAKADVQSPFGIYTAKMKECNGRSEKACTADDHCLWKPSDFWAPCIVGAKPFKEAMCSSTWQALLERAAECQGPTSKEDSPYNKEHPCEMPLDEWYSMSFGKHIKTGATLAKLMQKQKGCQSGPWKKPCEAMLDASRRCNSQQSKDHTCTDGCYKQAGKCVMTHKAFVPFCGQNVTGAGHMDSAGRHNFAAVANAGVIIVATSILGLVI